MSNAPAGARSDISATSSRVTASSLRQAFAFALPSAKSKKDDNSVAGTPRGREATSRPTVPLETVIEQSYALGGPEAAAIMAASSKAVKRASKVKDQEKINEKKSNKNRRPFVSARFKNRIPQSNDTEALLAKMAVQKQRDKSILQQIEERERMRARIDGMLNRAGFGRPMSDPSKEFAAMCEDAARTVAKQAAKHEPTVLSVRSKVLYQAPASAAAAPAADTAALKDNAAAQQQQQSGGFWTAPSAFAFIPLHNAELSRRKEPSAALEAARALMHEVSVSQEGGLTHRERLQLGLVEANAQLITTSTFAPR